MFSSSRLALPTFVLSAVLFALAEPTPSEPSPGEVFNEGATCNIAWTPDSTGTWKTLNIELMTGNNIDMQHLSTVASVDGTASPGTFSYPCPAVTINSAIYFYQFSSPAAPTDLTWTGRFAIADSTGATVPPPNANQPNGQPIPWGTGALTDPSTAVPAPSYLAGSGNTTSPVSSTSANGTSSSLTPSSTGSSTSSLGTSTTSTLSTSSPSGTSSGLPAVASNSPSTSTTNNSAGGLAVGAVSTRAAQAGVSLAVIAATFTFLF